MAAFLVWTAMFFLSSCLRQTASIEFEAATNPLSLCPGEELLLRCSSDIGKLTNIFLSVNTCLVASVSIDDQGRVDRSFYDQCPLGRALDRSEGSMTQTAKGFRLSIPYRDDLSGTYMCGMKFKDLPRKDETVTITSKPLQSCSAPGKTTHPPKPGTTTPCGNQQPCDVISPPSDIAHKPQEAKPDNSASRMTQNYASLAVVIIFAIHVMLL